MAHGVSRPRTSVSVLRVGWFCARPIRVEAQTTKLKSISSNRNALAIAKALALLPR